MHRTCKTTRKRGTNIMLLQIVLFTLLRMSTTLTYCFDILSGILSDIWSGPGVPWSRTKENENRKEELYLYKNLETSSPARCAKTRTVFIVILRFIYIYISIMYLFIYFYLLICIYIYIHNVRL